MLNLVILMLNFVILMQNFVTRMLNLVILMLNFVILMLFFFFSFFFSDSVRKCISMKHFRECQQLHFYERYLRVSARTSVPTAKLLFFPQASH